MTQPGGRKPATRSVFALAAPRLVAGGGGVGGILGGAVALLLDKDLAQGGILGGVLGMILGALLAILQANGL